MITRRQVIIGGAVALATPTLLLQTGCASKKQLVQWSITGLETLKEVQPTLALMGATQVVDLIDKALPYAEQLRKALNDDDIPSAGNVLEKLLGADGWLVKIADAVGILKDEHRKTIVMGLLATVQIAYNLIMKQIKNDTPMATATAMRQSAPKQAAVMDAAEAKLRSAFEVTRF